MEVGIFFSCKSADFGLGWVGRELTTAIITVGERLEVDIDSAFFFFLRLCSFFVIYIFYLF